MSDFIVPIQVKFINQYVLVSSDELGIHLTVGSINATLDLRKIGQAVMQIVSKRLDTQPAKRYVRSVTQMAKIHGVSPMTIRRMETRGELRAFRTPGGHRRYWSDK